MTDLTVSRLSVTPVKGLALHHPESVDLTTGGVEGDRAFLLVDAAGEMASCTDIGALMTIRADYDAANHLGRRERERERERERWK